MENKLNVLLADFVVEYHKLQNYHWYVKGEGFFTTHAKLEEIYTAINGVIDELAENMLMLGMKPAASLAEFMALTQIKEASTQEINSSEILKSVLADFEYFKASVLAIKIQADEENNFLISAIMDGYFAQFSKNIWMLKQTLK